MDIDPAALAEGQRGTLAELLGIRFVEASKDRGGAGPPSDQLRVQIDNVLKVFADPELQKDGKAGARRVAIRKIASDIFDFTEISKRSPGRHWQGRGAGQHAEV